MRVSTSQSPENQYQHFVDKDFNAILEIERQSKLRDLRTNLVMIDTCNPTWLLTVETVKS